MHMVVRAMFPEKVHQYIACHLYQSTRAPTYLSDCASFYHEGDGDFVKAKMFAQAMVRAQLKPVIYSPNGTDLVGDGTGDDVVFPELTSVPAAFGFAYAVARQLTKKNVGLDERNPIGMTVFSGKRSRE
jgi:hypothetical protein